MTGRYAIDLAEFATITQYTSARLDELAELVNEALSQMDVLSATVAAEGTVAGAFESATEPRRRSGPGAVARGGEVIAIGQQAALEYARADLAMEATATGASSAAPSSTGSLGRSVP